MNPIYRQNKKIAGILLFSLILGIFGGLWAEKVFAKDNYKAILKIADYVLPDFSFANSTEQEIKVLTILSVAKAKKRVNHETLTPNEVQFNEYDYREYAKASKKLFGKVIPHKLPDEMAAGGRDLFYNKKTKTIFQEEYYTPGDVTIRRNKRQVKKLGKNKYVVINLDSNYYPLSMDKRPTRKMSVFVKKTKKGGYVISEIKLEDIPLNTVKIDSNSVKKQIEKIKEWMETQPKNVIKKEFTHGEQDYIILWHKYNIVFICEKDAMMENSYYYKDGVPVKVMKTEDGEVLFSYELSYNKRGKAILNAQGFGTQDDIKGAFASADSLYDLVDRGFLK